jgi:serralysin
MAFFDLSNGNDFTNLFSGELFGFSDGLRALSGDDFVQGTSDNENINGNAGNDTVLGGFGNDYLRGGQNEDFIDGQASDDLLNGNFGNDFVQGNDGNDFVRGGQGNDTLNGGNSNDILVGDFGADDLIGDIGADTFVFRTNSAEQGVVNADVALDFNIFDGDLIGLDSSLSNLEIILNDSIDYSNIFGGNSGIVDTVISIAGSGLILGVVLDIGINDLSGRFVIVSDSELAQG